MSGFNGSGPFSKRGAFGKMKFTHTRPHGVGWGVIVSSAGQPFGLLLALTKAS